jgi:sec-independent protein translocase protein TatA
MQLGPAEVLVILVVALLVFGPNRLPEIGRQVGRGVRELRKFQDTIKRDLDEVMADDSVTSTPGGDPPPTLPPREIEAPAASSPDVSTSGANPSGANQSDAKPSGVTDAVPPTEPS